MVEGLKNLRTAALLNIISAILMGLGALAILPTFFMSITTPPVVSPLTLSSIIIFIILLLIGVVISFIALFAYLIPSFSRLKEYDSYSYGTPHSLIRIGYITGFIFLIVGIPLVIIGVGLVLMIVGAILLFIGKIGLIIGTLRLAETTGEGLFTGAAVLFIIGIFIPLLDFIAWILTYIASSPERMKIQPPTLPPPPA